ncbi:MAB_1171c family putative transporter [Streptomyces sp. NPDC055400]
MAFVFLFCLGVAVAWKWYQLSKAPSDRPLRSVTLCLTCAAASYPVAMPGGATGLDTVAGDGAAKVAQNLLLLATVYFLMCFYLYAAADERRGRRRVRAEAALVLVVGVAITAAAASVPHRELAGSFATTDMTVWQVAFFYAVAGVYLMYALTVAGLWTRRYARLSMRPHSTGLWAAGAGMVGMATACAMRAVIVAARWRGAAVSDSVLLCVALILVCSSLLFVLGITYPGLRTRLSLCRLWLRHRREHARLEPLWLLMTEAAPHVVLKSDSRSRWDQWRARGVHRRHHRRFVECRDGLVEISPYLESNPRSDAVSDETNVDRVAEQLRAAVYSRRSGVPTNAATPTMPTLPGPRSREADMQELLALSDALRSTTDLQHKENRATC